MEGTQEEYGACGRRPGDIGGVSNTKSTKSLTVILSR